MELSHEQKQVIDTQNKSLLVSASAGSGKTFVVIERIIESIKCGTDVSSLLVLTFTNAAASELKERLITRLHKLKDEYLENGDKTNAVRIAKQISKVPMSDISTIHSFCLNIIRNNFYTLGIDPNVTTLDATQATIMLNETINDVIEEAYELKQEEFLDVLDILGGETSLINNIYMFYNAYRNILENNLWLDKIINTYNTKIGTDLSKTEFGQVILESIKSRLKLMSLELENCIMRLDSLEDFETRKEVLKTILKNINNAISFTTYDELFKYMPELLSVPSLPSTKVSDEDLKEEIKALKNKIAGELKDISVIIYKDSEGIINELNETCKYIKWYVQIVQSIDSKYSEAKREKSVIDFADYEHLALKALKDNNVRTKYINKYEQIYVDEYQDTSNAQEAIIQMVAKDNNVIMVGDVKQSIYAFRNAKPELFTHKYETLKEIEKAEDENAAKIILAQNFRSRKEVLSSTNDIFSMLMSKDFGGANYDKKEALTYGNGYDYSLEQSYKTEINIIEKENEEKDEDDAQDENFSNLELEGALVANRINELVNSKFQIYDLKKKEYRPCSYKDIVILLRTVENKADIVSKVLASHGIPCFADSKTGFYNSEEIELIISFLKVLDNPHDDISLVSVMYSIIGKFNLDELAQIRYKNSSKSVMDSLYLALDATIDSAIKNKINNFLELLERFKQYVKTYKISELLLKLYNETGIYEALRIEKLGELKCTNLDNFVDIVSNFEKSEKTVSLYLLIKYLNVLKSKESAGDSPKLLGENEDVVRIMTMHKSKGLEFPIVILMNTAAKYNERDTKDRLQFEETLGVGVDILNKDMGIIYPSIIKQAIKSKTKQTLRAEALRLLYVAFTRAKEKLIICGTVSNLDKYFSKTLEVKNKEASELIAASYDSHLKCILHTAITKNEDFDVNLYNAKEFAINKNEQDILDRNKTKLARLLYIKDKFELKEDKKKIQELKEKFVLNYEFEDINKKYTVTELKATDSNLLDKKPQALESKLTGASYGTLIHAIVQNLDYNNITEERVMSTAKTVVNSFGMQDKVNLKHITQSIIQMCVALQKYLQNARCIKNELEFVIKDNLEGIEEVNLVKPALIQGVVDMYVVTKDGKSIVIDFKTDKVNNEEELLERYKIQLKVYKKAIEIAYGKQVEKTYIYSFGLNKLIEVK